ncbi:right-handed parallel beta-helix repeat-containing protein, partial [bacterium]|nr:right-handed parallel beta-helix repeat-containing protein [bacterium]
MSSDPLIYNCIIDQNSAEKASGIYLVGGRPKVVDCDITSNVSTGSGGAGLYIKNTNGSWVVRCNVSDNTADGSGGGILCLNANTSIDCCLITNNSSDSWGGGIQFQYSSATLSNCTLAGNTSSQGSAILYNFDDKSKIINSISWNPSVDREIFATGSE